MTDSTLFDAVVVGGGPAGLSAALSLARACRRVLLATEELVRIGRAQLAPYDVTIREERAVDAEQSNGGFAVTFAGGDRVEARGIILATGVRDVLPDVPGLSDLWGTGVFHCPYCHGWEVAGRPLAIYAQGGKVLHLCRLIRGWTDDLFVFTDGPSGLPPADLARIERNGIVVREERIERLVGAHGELVAVVLAGGDVVQRDGLFISPKQELASDLSHRLGCRHTDEGRVEAGVAGRTPVPGVFVAGDAGPGMQSVVSAMASGTAAGAMLNHDLLEAEFDR